MMRPWQIILSNKCRDDLMIRGTIDNNDVNLALHTGDTSNELLSSAF